MIEPAALPTSRDELRVQPFLTSGKIRKIHLARGIKLILFLAYLVQAALYSNN
jgi:hypothetical protein